MINKINELCEALGLEKVQSTCPKCANSYISLYKLVDNTCYTKLIACYCNKCNHEWVTEDLRQIDEEIKEKKYVIKIDSEDKFLMKDWTREEAYCPLFEDALLMTLSEVKEVLDVEETVYEVVNENGEIKLVEVDIK